MKPDINSANQEWSCFLDNCPNTFWLIDKFYQQDNNFKELCDDYLSCSGHIDYLAREKVTNLEQYREYRVLCDDLSQEISDYLNHRPESLANGLLDSTQINRHEDKNDDRS